MRSSTHSCVTEMRSREQIHADLDAAHALDRKLPMRSPEYKANRQQIANLNDELMPHLAKVSGAFTSADYARSPDSFAQSAVNRRERRCDVHGCEMEHGEASYTCRDERCTAKRICVGCSFNCFDCTEEFCERHVTDVLRGSTKYAEFVCDGCLRKRQERKVA